MGNDNVGNYGIGNFIVDWSYPQHDFRTSIGQSNNNYYNFLTDTFRKASDFVLSYNNQTGELSITGGTWTDSMYIHGGSPNDYVNTYNANPVVYFCDGCEIIEIQ